MTKQIVDLEEYIRIGEPSQRERAEAWQLAIGLQAVDQLHVSSYLLQTASDPHLKQQQMTELIHKSMASVDKREAECLGWHSAIAKRRKGGGTPSARQGRKRFIAL